ncbi:MAG: hypothetical protein JNL39_17235 [Opitutaceae bacterium]|nr:hypothetical protein [Opitutaceae bacterium]
MKSPLGRAAALATILWVSAGRLFAHPGHDGDHDFTWELRHLVEHPFATAGWLALAGVTAGTVWWVLRLRSATIQSLRTSQASRGK